MKTRITGSLAAFTVSLAFFISADTISDVTDLIYHANGNLVAPGLLQLIEAFVPLNAVLFFIYPALFAGIFWLSARDATAGTGSFVWYCLAALHSFALIIALLVVRNVYIMPLAPESDVSSVRMAGNALLILLLATGFGCALKRQGRR